MRNGISQELLEDDMKCKIGAVKAAPEYAGASHSELRHDVRKHLRGRGSRKGEKRNTGQARAQPSNGTIGGTKLVAPAFEQDGGAEVLGGRSGNETAHDSVCPHLLMQCASSTATRRRRRRRARLSIAAAVRPTTAPSGVQKSTRIRGLSTSRPL